MPTFRDITITRAEEKARQARPLGLYRILNGLLRERDAFLATIVCSLIVIGREQEAAELCVRAGNSPAGFRALMAPFPKWRSPGFEFVRETAPYTDAPKSF